MRYFIQANVQTNVKAKGKAKQKSYPQRKEIFFFFAIVSFYSSECRDECKCKGKSKAKEQSPVAK
jgi:hypothetical protein